MNASRTKSIAMSVFICLILCVMLFPPLITLLGSILKNDPGQMLLNKGIGTIHPEFTLDKYYTILFRKPDFLALFWNSAIITAPVILFQLIFGSMAAYGFSAFKFPLRDTLFYMLVLVMILPFQATSVPNFIMLKRMNLLGSYSAVILPGIFQAFGVFLLRQNMKGIDQEYYDAAKMDGSGRIRLFFSIALPMTKNALVALGLLTFLDCWNMVEQPLVFLDSPRMFPLSVMMSSISSSNSSLAYACAVLYTLPAFLVFWGNEDRLAEGMSLISIK